MSLGLPAGLTPQPMQHPVKDREQMVDAQMYTDPFVGWRCWAIEPNDDRIILRSITYKCNWTPEEKMEAKCLSTFSGEKVFPDRHTVPNRDHGCGIYAVTEKEHALGWLNQYWMSIYQNPKTFRAIGNVKLWGNVIKFTRGYLAQYAYPDKIWIPHEAPSEFPIEPRECVQELRKTYRGVEVNLL